MSMKNSRGVTLIMVAAVLAILAALATGFYTMMLMQTKSAVRYSDAVRTDMVAKAGISYAVGQLRAQAFKRTEDASSAWYQMDYLRGASKRISYPDSPYLHDGVDHDGDGEVGNPEDAFAPPDALDKLRGYSVAVSASAGNDSDRFALNISDAAAKININAGDNLAVILDNLCRVIGPPLVAADLDALQPRRWYEEAKADPADPAVALYDTPLNKNDLPTFNDLYYTLTDEGGAVVPPTKPGRPTRFTSAPKTLGQAVYGDGYAIAGYRARNGAFRNPEDIKDALTYIERNGNNLPDDPLEQLEIEVKYAAIRDHITTSSWVDTNTVCVGKFEWVHIDTAKGKTYAIDRDKSWVIDDPVKDPMNVRGSLRGSYVSIMNGHGAGQLRRIRTNGIDWLEVENGFAVTPGPISSYMIISNEEALLMDVNGSPLPAYSYPDKPPPAGTVTFPQTKVDGTLIRNPKMDYSLRPLCIHRAPVNVNTATDKVLVALLLGINVQHGHPLALGTDTDVEELRPNHPGKEWKKDDVHKVQPYVLTPRGLKRIPAASGKPILNRSWGMGVDQVVPPPAVYDVKYVNNYDNLGSPNFLSASSGSGLMTEAHELAYRIIMARQADKLQPTLLYIDPKTGSPTTSAIGALGVPNPPRGPFRTYDDLYSKVIRPFDEARFANGTVGAVYHAARISNVLMANFNSNTDILKFNPNIEWIDRWGRNFTEQEPLMVYTNNQAWGATSTADVPASDAIDQNSVPLYTAVFDPTAGGWAGGNVPPPTSGQKNAGGTYIAGAYITRSFRYKSDEMIDKTDLNRSTTEFSFDSNGIFEIVSTGQVAKVGQVLAERKFTALIKVYDVWRESTQQQFVMGTISRALGNRNDPKDTANLSCSGQLARDASGLVERKGLVTLPEPLLPLKARIVNEITGQAASTKTVPNREVVSSISVPSAPNTGNLDPLDAFGKARKNPYDSGASPIDVPEVLANRVLPARWDGQIVLATNTSAYDPTQGGDDDTFLASFDGDLDTATCEGNGREQAKWPYSAESDGTGNYKYTSANATRPDGTPVSGSELRCVQGVGLLGVLFDKLIASDPGIPLVDGITPFNTAAQMTQARWVYPFLGISTCLMPTKLFGTAGVERPSYWNNVTVRMGSLRTDGVYLSSPGVSGNTATLKYCYTPDSTRRNKLNFEPNAPNGNCITMWAKSAWHHDDMRTHEFFNPGNVALTNQCTAYYFQKTGQYKWCSQSQGGLGHCGNRRDINDLSCLMAYEDGSGWGSALHGGYGSTNVTLKVNESPSYRVQPFRWSFVGYRAHYKTNVPVPDSPSAAKYSTGPRGHVTSYSPMEWQDPQAVVCEQYYIRPFIDTELFGEQEANWNAGNSSNGLRLRWSYKGWAPWSYTLGGGNCSVGFSRDVVGGPTSTAQPNPTQGGRYGEGQDAKWVWAEPYGKVADDPGRAGYSPKTFGMNNLNFGNPSYNAAYSGSSTQLYWHYRNFPEDGTYAVIDEFKISKKERILADSGSTAAGWASDRVSREMQISRYYLPPQPGTRQSPAAGGPPTFTSQTLLQSLKGFDKLKDNQNVAVVRLSWNVFTPRFMCEYMKPGNFQRTENLTNYSGPNPIPFKGPFDYVKYNDYLDTSAYSVNRPAPWEYKAPMVPQSGRGVEVELISADAPATQAVLDGAPKLDGKTFTDPSAVNSLGKPELPVFCLASKLRYRVRFLYPVDPLVDPAGGKVANPAQHYLLDTPVFDDISVTYMIAPRILAFRELVE